MTTSRHQVAEMMRTEALESMRDDVAVKHILALIDVYKLSDEQLLAALMVSGMLLSRFPQLSSELALIKTPT